MKLLIMQFFIFLSLRLYLSKYSPQHPFLRHRMCIILPKVLVWNYLSLFIFTELMGIKVLPRLLIAKTLFQS
jgi:hypothetical protein